MTNITVGSAGNDALPQGDADGTYVQEAPDYDTVEEYNYVE
jgi:hypothetical protein